MTVYPTGPQDDIKYVMTAPDGSRAAFNDPSDADYVGMARWTGLDSADIRESIQPRSGAHGAVQGLNLRGPRPVVGNIEILATSTTDRNNKWQKLRRACNALDADGTLTFTPDGGIASQIFFRLNQPPRRADEPGWLSKAQVGLVSAGPYIVGQTLRSQASSGGVAAVTNQGDGPAAPVVLLTATGVTTITLSNATVDEGISLASLDASSYFSFVSSFVHDGVIGAIAIDSSNNIFVADVMAHKVVKYNSSGVFQSEFGSYGTGNNNFGSPVGLAIDSSNNIFVADQVNRRILKYNSSFTYQAQVGSAGTGNGQFGAQSPRGLAVDSSGNVFACDAGNNRVQKFTNALAYSTQFGSAGSGNGQFAFPNSVTVDSTGAPAVADLNNFRVQKFTNAATPVYASQLGAYGTENGQFLYPYAVAFDSSNRIHVVDPQRKDVQVFATGNTFINKYGSAGTDDGEFGYPVAAAKTGNDMLIGDATSTEVVKFSNSAVLRFDFETATLTIGGQNAYNLIDVPVSVWWELLPGDNSVVGAGASSFTVYWRDTWL